MNIIKNIYLHWKYNRILKRVYKDENILTNLSALLNSNVKIDWIGRIYTVLNPNLIKKTDQIYEVTDNGLDNSAFIEKWLMDRFIIMEHFIKANNLFDLLTFSINKIDEHENYLVILEPITLRDCKKSIKYLLISLIILLLIGIICMVIF